MGDQTAIEWADATWNPWWGCTKVSPACTNCYAETLANRFHHGLWRGDRRRMQDWSLPAKVDRRAARWAAHCVTTCTRGLWGVA